MKNHVIENIHKDSVKAGDTIIHNGELRTVSASDIKHTGFMGRTIFGDSYAIGNKLVQLVTKAGE